MLPSAASNRSSADQCGGRASFLWIAIERRRLHRLAAASGGWPSCAATAPANTALLAHDSAPGPRVQSSHSVVGSPNGGGAALAAATAYGAPAPNATTREHKSPARDRVLDGHIARIVDQTKIARAPRAAARKATGGPRSRFAGARPPTRSGARTGHRMARIRAIRLTDPAEWRRRRTAPIAADCPWQARRGRARIEPRGAGAAHPREDAP